MKKVQLLLVGVFALSGACLSAHARGLIPVGPELAPPQIGHLIKAWPLEMQTNALAPGGVGVIMWGCKYRVGKAQITLAPIVQPGDPMPCKRELKFTN